MATVNGIGLEAGCIEGNCFAGERLKGARKTKSPVARTGLFVLKTLVGRE
jgi:hypothetical protein